MQNHVQSSIVFEKTDILFENSKTSKNSKIRKLQLPYSSSYFFWEFAHVSYLPMPTKGCVGLFLFCLDLELFAQIKKDLVSTHSLFTLLLIIQDLNKIKISHTLL